MRSSRSMRASAACALATALLVATTLPAIGDPHCFQALPVHAHGDSVFGLIWGDFDPDHPGSECAYLAQDGSIVECRPDGLPWSPTLIYQGDDPILLMDQRPTLSWGDVQASHDGSEIVVFAFGQLNVVHRTAAGGWSHVRLFDTAGMVGSGWGARVGDYHPLYDGVEILMIFEGVLDSSVATIFAEVAGAWRDTAIYLGEVGMDSGAGEFNPDHEGPEIVITTEMGPTYEITAPDSLERDYWPNRMIWLDYEHAGWVIEIGDVDPVHPGNEIVFGTRYSNSILVSGQIDLGWHEYEVVFTGSTTEIPRDMWDIDLGDVLPEVPGQEIVGVDNSGNVYLVWHDGGWQGETIWTDPDGPLYGVVADEIDPASPGDEILVVGLSGTITLLTRITTGIPGGPESGVAAIRCSPNPFGAATRIVVAVEGSEPCGLTIHDVSGRVVRRLGSVRRGRREVVWDGRDDAGDRVASGVYWCTLDCDARRESARIVLVR